MSNIPINKMFFFSQEIYEHENFAYHSTPFYLVTNNSSLFVLFNRNKILFSLLLLYYEMFYDVLNLQTVLSHNYVSNHPDNHGAIHSYTIFSIVITNNKFSIGMKLFCKEKAIRNTSIQDKCSICK